MRRLLLTFAGGGCPLGWGIVTFPAIAGASRLALASMMGCSAYFHDEMDLPRALIARKAGRMSISREAPPARQRRMGDKSKRLGEVLFSHPAASLHWSSSLSRPFALAPFSAASGLVGGL